MSYQRFHIETVAGVATVAATDADPAPAPEPQTVADVASVAGASTKPRFPIPVRELLVLFEKASAGRSRDEALTLLAATLRNDPRLCRPQTSLNHCHVCNQAEDAERALIPVLSALSGRPHWIHVGCHAEHVARVTEQVDEHLQTIQSSPL